MIVKNSLNNGLAEVDDELGAKLVESGSWTAYDGAEAKPVRKTRVRKAVEESTSEE